MLFAPARGLQGLGACEGCVDEPMSGLGDISTTYNATTGSTTYDYKSGGVDPATGTKVVLEAFSDLFTGKREKDASRDAAARLATIQAQTDAASLQQRAMATERWTAVAPWALLVAGVMGIGIIFLKASK